MVSTISSAAQAVRVLFSSAFWLRVMQVFALLLAGVILGIGEPAVAADAPESTPAVRNEAWAFHAQFTYVEQEVSGFNAPYAGANSLTSRRAKETTDLTLYLGARLWSGAEFWINPEIDQGFGLDNTLGVAGFPSGEAYKVGKKQPYLRLQRIFVRQTLDLPGEREAIEAEVNQLGGERNFNRWVFTIGKFGVTDIFDVNQYAHDPRNDFLNWAAVDAGSFDYAADAWGYTVGAAVEWYQGTWTTRLGVFDLSKVPNSVRLDPGFHEFQIVAELEKRHTLLDHPGKIMVTLFDSRGRMGLLDSAVQLALATAQAVDISAVRQYRSRLGASLNLEQQLSKDLGFFARVGKAAGNVEAYDFTDIDRSFAAGLSLKGTSWHREHDTMGLAGLVNNISADRQRFFNAGGLGILVGDGRLPHPGPEKIFETYYNAQLFSRTQLSFDYQRVEHPAYNRDRGPASIYAVRFHAQF
ncbi:MAG: carbohydrate porin [Pseudomonadota bacterium]|nr:carbohydrate porin [Pseudomonadota bacterium]